MQVLDQDGSVWRQGEKDDGKLVGDGEATTAGLVGLARDDAAGADATLTMAHESVSTSEALTARERRARVDEARSAIQQREFEGGG